MLCLDDYHLNDREGRKESGLTALNLAEQDFAYAIPSRNHSRTRAIDLARAGYAQTLTRAPAPDPKDSRAIYGIFSATRSARRSSACRFPA